MYKNKLFTGFLAAGLLFIMAGCEKEKTPEKKGVFVSTSSMTNISLVAPANTVSATAGGDADFVGSESITERGFCWALTTKPTTANNKATATGTGTGNFSINLSGLTFGAIYYVRAYVISNGKTYYGNEVKFTASVPVELIQNGDFSLPNDPGVGQINSLPNWKTDETGPNLGRGKDNNWDPSNYIFWTNDWSKGIYQVVGTVPALQSDYAIGFDGNYDWTDWGGYSTPINVIFSVYSGADPRTRVTIGIVQISTGAFPGWGNNWGRKTGTFSIPPGSAHVGKNLVVEFDVLPYDDGSSGLNPGLWYNIDDISVIQTLR